MAATERPYHHGDLRNALLAAAIELAASGGPDAISVRAAARAAGVAPSAVYRHFDDREHLLAAVREHAANRLASAMRQGAGALCATAKAYICFAATEPGLFRTVSPRFAPGHRPFQVVDGVRLGPAAEMAVWSSVHGLAVLVSDGPLRDVPGAVRDEAVERMLAALRHSIRETQWPVSKR
ncbi:TetR-like C-terminal domain-containing protein [Kibdelosporangium phytohabitans]|uniref:HTH tetR-type domain-containing protein n=1 Tax=Kibdelosporangium phytohabitans TaxID=860235 RepID=A0A0N9I4F4_9PSEU|nr:TetR-like C-terminal domain-containing protein [Kibdelosporangium phytohabitans]ALG10769.1 hypothetical protein AOZ06_31245 [Kibdelosporangium phytohabitans]MBE1461927.1 AcrR family transcriptional regulator [Kibdelosporangium phytohabitans]